MSTKEHISIRLEKGLISEIDKEKSDLSRNAFIVKILSNHFEHKVSTDVAQDEHIIALLEELKKDKSTLLERISNLERMLDQEQRLHLQTQKALEPPEKIKRRWKFWKK